MKYEQYLDKAVGVTFGDCQKVLPTLKRGEVLELIPEPENPYDPNAIRVESNGKKCGYIKRDGWLSKMILEEKVVPHCEVYQVTGGCNGLNYGLTMRILV